MAKKQNIANIRKNKKQTVKEGLGRRQLLKMGLLTGAGYLAPKGAWAQDQCPPGNCTQNPCQLGCSPAIDPAYDWMDPLPIPPVLPERQLTDPGFQPRAPQTCPFHDINPNTGRPYEGRGQYNGTLQEGTDCFQFFDDPRYGPQKYFIERMRASSAFRITSDPGIPDQTIWGFNLGGSECTDVAMFPGPTIVSRYQQPIVVRRYNELPTANGGFGINETTTHLHNFHSGTESDGGPCRYFFQGQYFDYYYAMQQAGFASTHPPNGDVNESLSTLWYHDHRDMHTAENVYKGLAGFHLIFSGSTDYDTGNENTGFKLPSFFDDNGVPLGSSSFDIPLMLNDKLLHHDTKLFCFDTMSNNGLVGDIYLVNGRYRSFLAVKQRRYRFRILDGGPSRFYTLFLTNPDDLTQTIPFWVIANDGNLLPQPVQVTTGLRVSVAERYDIIVDFAQIVRDHPGITRLRLENRLLQNCGQAPADSVPIQDAGHDNGQGYLLEFQIGEVVPDNSVDPASMPHFFDLPDKTQTPWITRCFVFNNNGPAGNPWAINDQVMNCNVRRFAVQQNLAEHWRLMNILNPFFFWNHPIHIHLEEHQILSKTRISTGENIPLSDIEMSRKDVIELHPDEEIKIFMRFRDFVGNDVDPGDYPMHCHNTVHEDHAMMLLWQVQPVGNSNESCP